MARKGPPPIATQARVWRGGGYVEYMPPSRPFAPHKGGVRGPFATLIFGYPGIRVCT